MYTHTHTYTHIVYVRDTSCWYLELKPMCNSVKQKSSHLDLKLGEKKKKGESIDWFLTKPADNIQARLRSDCQDSCKIAKLGAFSLAPRSIAWHLFGSTEQPGYTPWNVQGWGSWCCWKPPWTVHPSVTVSHSCASFWCQDKWHKFIYFYSITEWKSKWEAQEVALCCVLNKTSTQIQFNPLGCYQMETMVILREKNTNIILQVGCVHWSFHLAEKQILSD